MASKLWTTPNAVQCRVSSRKLGPHTDPVFYCSRLKKGSEESLERARKRSRTSPDPFEDCSNTWREPEPSPTLVYTSCSECTGPKSSRKNHNKERSTTDEIRVGLRKRSRGTPSPSEDHTQTILSTEGEGKKNQKRKSDAETQKPRKRSRRTPSPYEDPSQQTTTPASSSGKPATSSSVNTGPPNSRAAFKSKYEEHGLLGVGGFGSVYEGYSKRDNIPVAIKHIAQSTVKRTAMYLNNEIKMVPLEVALMLKLKPAEGGTCATVTLLDWYDLDNELILVLERPVPCLNLLEYVDSRGSVLQENEAKIIARQLVDALIEVHSKEVFHGDIKMNNILIETSSDVPRVRLIDFGCGKSLTEGKYTLEEEYSFPQPFMRRWYRAMPTTVWQLGKVVFGMLHDDLPFCYSQGNIAGNPPINDSLSDDCQSFILSCSPQSTLETLKDHRWLM